jgi:hypothetical protein
MYMSMNEIKNKIEEIKNALEIIYISLPLDYDKFGTIFNKLTNCIINFDLNPRIESTQRLSENIELRVFYDVDNVECDELEFDVVTRIIDVFDENKTSGIILNTKLIDIKPHW